MACMLLLAIQTVRVCGLQSTPDQQQTKAEQIADGTVVSGSGTVYKIEDKSKNTAVYLKQNQMTGQERNLEEAKLLVYIRPEQLQRELNIGDRVVFQGEKTSFETARNPGNFDQKSYYQVQGIHVMVRAEEMKILYPWEQQRIWWRRIAAGVENRLRQLRIHWSSELEQSLGEYYGNTMRAVLLGDKSGLDSEMKKLYQKNGIGHLLAISGLHMSLIGRSVYQFLRKRGSSFLFAGICSGGILLLYLVMVGPQVSSFRAVMMFLIWIGAEVTGRKYDLLTSLSFTATILCIYQPLYLTDRSFLLSFGAILGIALLKPCFEWRNESEKKEGEESRKNKSLFYIKSLFCGWLKVLAEKISDGLSVSLAVNGMLLGIMLYFYYEIPPYSLLLNLMLVPLFPIVMLAGILGLFTVGLPLSLSNICFWCAGEMLQLYDQICEIFAQIPGSRIVTGQPEKWWVMVYYVAVLVVWGICYVRKNRKQGKYTRVCLKNHSCNLHAPLCGIFCLHSVDVVRYAALIQTKSPTNCGIHLTESIFQTHSGLEEDKFNREKESKSESKRQRGNRKIAYGLILGIMFGFVLFCKGKSMDHSQLQVTMIDVGQGDSIFIKDREGIVYLVDGGSSSVTSVGSYRMEPFLLSQGIAQLDYVFATHGDEDHVNGIQELLEGQTLGIKIRTLVLPPEEYVDEKLKDLAQTAVEHGTKVAVIRQGQRVGRVLTCLGPVGTSETDKNKMVGVLEAGNEASTVLKLEDGVFRMLLTGDLEGNGEKQLTETLNKEQGSHFLILKAGHHGSKNSSSAEFLKTVSPRATLISAGKNNRYGHPHAETLERLREAGSKVWSTQECGAITLRSDGEKVRIEKYVKSRSFQ